MDYNNVSDLPESLTGLNNISYIDPNNNALCIETFSLDLLNFLDTKYGSTTRQTSQDTNNCDPDLDGIVTINDNCPSVANPGQEDSDEVTGTTNFVHESVNEYQSKVADCLEDEVCLTRDRSGAPYNTGSAEIERAVGQCEDLELTFYTSLPEAMNYSMINLP